MKYSKLYFEIRSRYQLKRKSKSWKKRKGKKIRLKKDEFIEESKKFAEENEIIKYSTDYINYKAPEDFSFIDNTDEVLLYLKKCNIAFRNNEKVNFDIKDIKILTPDAISLFVAKINDSSFTLNGNYIGNAPKDEKLKKLFFDSGFFNYVNTSSEYKNGENKDCNLLHKENDYKVRPNIAKEVCKKGINHVFKNDKPFEPLYEIIIEAMQNTNNHANPYSDSSTKWWIYVYNDIDTGNSVYSFIDLGVGIFDSMVVKSYIQRTIKDFGMIHNVNYVDDLLAGRIQSRIEEDNEIRGKGIPQIVKNAECDCFKRFFIISNNVKIDIKEKKGIKLENEFRGTFIYWEFQNNIKNGN